MFRLDTYTHQLMALDRVDSLNRSFREPPREADSVSADREQRGGVTPAPSPSPLRALRTTAAPLRSSRA
jgi:hypothetical protein